MMAFWYHFAILFEALFILTAVDAGTRAGRFMLQDLLGSFVPALKRTESLTANLIATGLCVAAWGYFLYQGVVDPLGGINTLWPLFGISNQMLAAVALLLGTVVLFKMKRERYAWVTLAPAAWLLICTLTAGWQKVFSGDPKVGFLSHATRYADALAQGQLLAPAKTAGAMSRIVFNDRLDAALCVLFMGVVVSVLIYSVRAALSARGSGVPTARETPFEPMPAGAR
jgi:carbon starvation protein